MNIKDQMTYMRGAISAALNKPKVVRPIETYPFKMSGMSPAQKIRAVEPRKMDWLRREAMIVAFRACDARDGGK